MLPIRPSASESVQVISDSVRDRYGLDGGVGVDNTAEAPDPDRSLDRRLPRVDRVDRRLGSDAGDRRRARRAERLHLADRSVHGRLERLGPHLGQALGRDREEGGLHRRTPDLHDRHAPQRPRVGHEVAHRLQGPPGCRRRCAAGPDVHRHRRPLPRRGAGVRHQLHVNRLGLLERRRPCPRRVADRERGMALDLPDRRRSRNGGRADSAPRDAQAGRDGQGIRPAGGRSLRAGNRIPHAPRRVGGEPARAGSGPRGDRRAGHRVVRGAGAERKEPPPPPEVAQRQVRGDGHGRELRRRLRLLRNDIGDACGPPVGPRPRADSCRAGHRLRNPRMGRSRERGVEARRGPRGRCAREARPLAHSGEHGRHLGGRGSGIPCPDGSVAPDARLRDGDGGAADADSHPDAFQEGGARDNDVYAGVHEGPRWKHGISGDVVPDGFVARGTPVRSADALICTGVFRPRARGDRPCATAAEGDHVPGPEGLREDVTRPSR